LGKVIHGLTISALRLFAFFYLLLLIGSEIAAFKGISLAVIGNITGWHL